MNDYSFFEHDLAFDEQKRTAGRQATAAALARAKNQFGAFLENDTAVRFAHVEDNIQQIIAEVVDEYGGDGNHIFATVSSVLSKGGFCDECRHWKSGPNAGCTCDSDKKDEPKEVEGPKEEKSEDDDLIIESALPDPNAQQPTDWDTNHQGFQQALEGMQPGHYLQDKSGYQGYVERHENNDNGNPWRSPTYTVNTQGFGQKGFPDAQSTYNHLREQGLQFNSPFEYQGTPTTPEQPITSTAGWHIVAVDAQGDYLGPTHREKLPKGDGKEIGTGPVPKMDKTRWKPNALNEKGNLPVIKTEDKDSRHPTEVQDIAQIADHSKDFKEQTKGGEHFENLKSTDSFDGSGYNTEKNIVQYPTRTFGDKNEQPSGVTKEVFPKNSKDDPCWDGYHKVPGKEDYEEDSCEKDSHTSAWSGPNSTCPECGANPESETKCSVCTAKPAA